MENRRILLLSLCLFIFVPLAGAQKKLEEEYRLKASHLTDWAIEFNRQLGDSVNVNWFLEKNLNGNSIEAKFKFQKHNFSVEFDTTGVLQDVEIEIRKNRISSNVFKTIEVQLDSIFIAYRINKIQEQYRPQSHKLSAFILNFSQIDEGIHSYEIVAAGKRKADVKRYELTFTNKGLLRKIDEIILRNTDNLAY